MVDQESAELLVRWQNGDQEAAGDLFRRYAERLIALVRSRLSEKLARRLDPEDVVQSVYRSFFAHARDGRYVLENSGDLWRLLVAITVHKLGHQVERHTADKRALDRESEFPGSESLFGLEAAFLASEPSPAEALALADELEQIMRSLDPLQRRMLEMRLQGWTLNEIATEVRRSLRTVRRVLDRIKEYLVRQFELNTGGAGHPEDFSP